MGYCKTDTTSVASSFHSVTYCCFELNVMLKLVLDPVGGFLAIHGAVTNHEINSLFETN